MNESCKETRLVSQLSLDGVALTRRAREQASLHRHSCRACMNFHQMLIQATALASELCAEDVLNAVDTRGLARKVEELIQENDLSMPEGDAPAGQSDCELKLYESFGAREHWRSTDAEQLISRTEQDGRIVERFTDGWMTVRAATKSEFEQSSSEEPAALQQENSSESSAHHKRASIFDLTSQDIDEIFNRLYWSRSKERHKGQAKEKAPPASERLGFRFSESALNRFGKIAVDKLDQTFDSTGLIKDVGKFLLDPEAVNSFERILQSKEVHGLVNRLTEEQNAVLDRLQDYIHRQHSVIATLVIGRDGLLLNARFRCDFYNEELANWALCTYFNSKVAAQLLNSQELYHIILSNRQGDVIISDFGKTFLITFTDEPDAVSRADLIRKLDLLIS